ncbi:MAG: indole-3-glycerol phosphate synthase TrpC [Nitrospiraceae bacterium]|nr:indole-3-glycerol phosphate synthase TrpC [Nitrospiraceae bacterium]
MSILDTIVGRKKERLLLARLKRPLSELKAVIRDMEPPRNFLTALRRDGGPVRMIAEVKKASPSKGLIRKDFDPAAIAAVYEAKAVDAISVITEEDFFHGSLDFLPLIKKAVTRPILRKDFIFDEYQVYESRANGADALLLIAALLSAGQAAEYLHHAAELGMSVLFEIHDEGELEKALEIKAPVVGINNRDLKTMTIDLATSVRLRKMIPPDRVVVSESGISSRDDVVALESSGIDAILVGTCLMESKDIGAKIDLLRGSKEGA